MLTRRRLKLLFLAVTHRMCVPSIMHSVTGNCTASCRDPNKIFKECKDALPPELLAQLKLVLHHNNPTKSIGYIIAEQHRKARACGNYTSVSKPPTKLETALSKEERNKCTEAFTCWL